MFGTLFSTVFLFDFKRSAYTENLSTIFTNPWNGFSHKIPEIKQKLCGIFRAKRRKKNVEQSAPSTATAPHTLLAPLFFSFMYTYLIFVVQALKWIHLHFVSPYFFAAVKRESHSNDLEWDLMFYVNKVLLHRILFSQNWCRVCVVSSVASLLIEPFVRDTECRE